MRLAAYAALLFAACLPFATSLLHAAEPAAEASMRVSGTITVDATGQPTGYALDHADAYPPGIRDLVAQVVPGWRFEPVLDDGAPVAARADMHLLFVARTRADGSVAIALRSASFGEPGGGELRSMNMRPPRYPLELLRNRVSGTVYVVLHVVLDGSVAEAFAEQTNLRKSGSRAQMDQWRHALERVALSQARHWTFAPREAAAGATSVRVPIDFVLRGTAAAKTAAEPAGRWDAYLPGAHLRAPWLTEAEFTMAGFDALPAGAFLEIGSGLKLLTPLNAG